MSLSHMLMISLCFIVAFGVAVVVVVIVIVIILSEHRFVFPHDQTLLQTFFMIIVIVSYAQRKSEKM